MVAMSAAPGAHAPALKRRACAVSVESVIGDCLLQVSTEALGGTSAYALRQFVAHVASGPKCAVKLFTGDRELQDGDPLERLPSHQGVRTVRAVFELEQQLDAAVPLEEQLDLVRDMLSAPQDEVRANGLRRLMSGGGGRACPANKIVDAGILPHVVALCRAPARKTVQDAALDLLESLTAEAGENPDAVIDSGVIPLIVEKLRFPDLGTEEVTLECLLNVIGQDPSFDALLVEANVAEPLAALLGALLAQPGRTHKSLLWCVAEALRSLVCGGVPLPVEVVESMLPPLRALVLAGETKALEPALRAFARLASAHGAARAAIAGLAVCLAGLLENGEPRLGGVAAAAVAAGLEGDGPHVEPLATAVLPSLPGLPRLLSHRDLVVQQDGHSVLQSLLRLGQGVAQWVIDAGLVPALLGRVRSENTPWLVFAAAAGAVSALAMELSHEQLMRVGGAGLLSCLLGSAAKVIGDGLSEDDGDADPAVTLSTHLLLASSRVVALGGLGQVSRDLLSGLVARDADSLYALEDEALRVLDADDDLVAAIGEVLDALEEGSEAPEAQEEQEERERRERLARQ